MPSPDDIGSWFDYGVREGFSHMLVIFDGFDQDIAPAYVTPDEDVYAIIERHGPANFQEVLGLYNMQAEKGPQLRNPLPIPRTSSAELERS